jgi:hypothetical protein
MVVYLQFSEKPLPELYRALKAVAFYRKGPDVGTERQSGWHIAYESVNGLAKVVKPMWKQLTVALMQARETIKRDPGSIPCARAGKRARLTVVKD